MHGGERHEVIWSLPCMTLTNQLLIHNLRKDETEKENTERHKRQKPKKKVVTGWLLHIRML